MSTLRAFTAVTEGICLECGFYSGWRTTLGLEGRAHGPRSPHCGETLATRDPERRQAKALVTGRLKSADRTKGLHGLASAQRAERLLDSWLARYALLAMTQMHRIWSYWYMGWAGDQDSSTDQPCSLATSTARSCSRTSRLRQWDKGRSSEERPSLGGSRCGGSKACASAAAAAATLRLSVHPRLYLKQAGVSLSTSAPPTRTMSNREVASSLHASRKKHVLLKHARHRSERMLAAIRVPRWAMLPLFLWAP